MTLITFQDGKPILTDDGKIGTEQACCCKKCEGPCGEENPCPEGCICCNGVCVEEIPEGECCGPCDEENPCPEGCICVDGECEACGGIQGGFGWYTDNYKADFIQFLLDLGYTNVVFTPASPFEGVPVPYTSGCGQTYYDVTYRCCGTFDFSNLCDPPFVVRTLRDAAGAGNQNPPCNISDDEVFLWVCCTEEPPP
jgi:hypothetical protein